MKEMLIAAMSSISNTAMPDVQISADCTTNAGSIASLMLTTEALVSEIPEEKKGAPMPGGHGGGMGDMY